MSRVRGGEPVRFRIPNARQGESYAGTIAPAPGEPSVILLDVVPAPGLALVGDVATGQLSGTPQAHGEFALDVHYRLSGDDPGLRRVSTATIYVNPDPRQLWKNLPSDRHAPYWKPDDAAQLIADRERRIIAARTRGRSHAHVGSCCDDDFFVHVDPDSGWQLAIVADGAGSAALSRVGSQLAVQAAGHQLRRTLGGDEGARVLAAVAALQANESVQTRLELHQALVATIGAAARQAMQALVDAACAAPERIPSVRELATTLLIGVTRRCGHQHLCAGYWVGDGVIGIHRDGQAPVLLGEVDGGEYAGQTRFLEPPELSPEALDRRVRYLLCDDFTAFMLMTDGVSDPRFESVAQLSDAGAWRALWAEIGHAVRPFDPDGQADQRLLGWLGFWSQGHHDDRTLAIVC